MSSPPTPLTPTVVHTASPESASPAGPVEALAPGTRIGRYLVLELAGKGGMGVVHAAFDPELDRKVAIKLVRASLPEAQSRLLREAQAMARLSHPNVVPIYDVGAFGPSVFLAMEFVRGQTLNEWVAASTRVWREVLAVVLGAGEGLAAAHHAGLIHRDFKPSNVLVGLDGRARVMDFGLARADTGSDTQPGLPDHSPLGQRLTELGAVVGTPGYMAPEQYGAEVSAAADQFAFCVTLYEALYRQPAFDGVTALDVAQATLDGRLSAVPDVSRVPPWLHRILLRGLSRRASDRFASMDELLAALRKDPSRARARRVAILAGALTLAASGVVTVGAIRRSTALCRGAEAKLAGVWDDTVAAGAGASFHATGKPYADAAWERVRPAMDAYARAWVSARTDACEAFRVRGEQTEHAMEARMSCLDRRLEELNTLAGVFSKADAKVVEKAGSAVAALSPLRDCSDLRLLGQSREPPPEQRAAVEEVRQQLARGIALSRAGRFAAADQVLRPAALRAQQIGFEALQAEADEALAELEGINGNLPEVSRLNERALSEAEGAGDDATAALALVHLTRGVGYYLQRPDEGRSWAAVAAGVLRRIGGNDRLQGMLAEALGDIDWFEGKQDASLAHYRQAGGVFEKAGGADNLEAARIHASIGWVLREQGHYREAEEEIRKSLEVRERVFGPEHPMVGTSWNDLAALAGDQGDYEESIRDAKRGLEILESATGHDAPVLMAGLVNVATNQAMAGRPAEGEKTLAKAWALLKAHPGLDPLFRSELAQAEWTLQREMHHPADAERWARESLKMIEAGPGAKSRFLPSALDTLAESLNDQGRYGEALPLAERSLALQGDSASRSGHAIALVTDARALLGLKRVKEARAQAEQALQILEPIHGIPEYLAETRFVLARALWSDPTQRPRALELAHQAQELYVQRHRSYDLAEVEAWLRSPR